MQLMQRESTLKQCGLNTVNSQSKLIVNCRRSLLTLAIATIVLMLTGCGSLIKPKTVVVTQSLPDLPANLAAPCGESQDLKTGRADEVLTLMIDDRRKLTECSLKQKSIVDLWKETQKETLK